MSKEQQYEIKQRGQTDATIQVTVQADTVRQAIDAVYRRYAREIQVPGFRRGHVPRAYLDTRFGTEAFLAEAQEDLQQKHLPEAFYALDLRPVSVPELEVVSFGESEGFVFEATFAVLPEVELPELSSVDVTVPALVDVSDEDVEATLGEVQTQFSTLGPKEGDTVSDGDIVHVKEKEQEWDTRAEEANPVTKALIGAKVGDSVEIDAELAEEKRLQTTLEILGLREVVLPELDDELAKDAGFDTLDALKDDIRTKMSEGRADQHKRFVDGQVLDAVIVKTELPLPDSFVDDLVNEEVERLKSSFAESQSISFEDYLEQRETDEEKLREEIREAVSLRVRREMVLRKLAEANGIQINDDELGDLAKQDAEAAGEDPLRFTARLKAEDRWDDYRSSKVNERVFAILRDAVQIKEEEA